MSLDVSLMVVRETTIYSGNITHNLGRMARDAGIYEYLWRPDEVGVDRAVQLVEPLSQGLDLLRSGPERFHSFDSDNGWGVYDDLCSFVEGYLEACRENPHAKVWVSR